MSMPPFWSEILPGLYLSGMFEWPTDYRGGVLCVLEQRPLEEPESAMWVPILISGDPVRASVGQLDAVADIIEDHLIKEVPLVVHCGAGIERSPLAMAWFFFRKRGMSLDEAYVFIKERRAIVEDRQHWLPASVRLGDDGAAG